MFILRYYFFLGFVNTKMITLIGLFMEIILNVVAANVLNEYVTYQEKKQIEMETQEMIKDGNYTFKHFVEYINNIKK